MCNELFRNYICVYLNFNTTLTPWSPDLPQTKWNPCFTWPASTRKTLILLVCINPECHKRCQLQNHDIAKHYPRICNMQLWNRFPKQQKYGACKSILTSLDGTQSGIPRFSWPASTDTPMTIGFRALKTCCGRILSLHGNTARCSFSRRRFSRNSSLEIRILFAKKSTDQCL